MEWFLGLDGGDGQGGFIFNQIGKVCLSHQIRSSTSLSKFSSENNQLVIIEINSFHKHFCTPIMMSESFRYKDTAVDKKDNISFILEL